mmetsp:Transcript_32118/g.91079  ORF Transcript_32118/g.91079 Transcript_32118/m.91079 type:complete len:317 (+) Transcript_32118:752-1702(+)
MAGVALARDVVKMQLRFDVCRDVRPVPLRVQGLHLPAVDVIKLDVAGSERVHKPLEVVVADVPPAHLLAVVVDVVVGGAEVQEQAAAASLQGRRLRHLLAEGQQQVVQVEYHRPAFWRLVNATALSLQATAERAKAGEQRVAECHGQRLDVRLHAAAVLRHDVEVGENGGVERAVNSVHPRLGSLIGGLHRFCPTGEPLVVVPRGHAQVGVVLIGAALPARRAAARGFALPSSGLPRAHVVAPAHFQLARDIIHAGLAACCRPVGATAASGVAKHAVSRGGRLQQRQYHHHWHQNGAQRPHWNDLPGETLLRRQKS